jgi:ankyrin repeat protein
VKKTIVFVVIFLCVGDEGVAVDMLDKDGRTALIHSVLHNHLELVVYLIEICKCDANVVDSKHNKTALDYAKTKNNKEIVEYLTKHNAK